MGGGIVEVARRAILSTIGRMRVAGLRGVISKGCARAREDRKAQPDGEHERPHGAGGARLAAAGKEDVMICVKCGQKLDPAPMTGAETPSVVLVVGAKPLPLRCGGCDRVVCHVCQTNREHREGGATAAEVSLECTFCGGLLELVHGPAPAPGPAASTPPVTDERRRELKHAYRLAKRAEAAERGLPPAIATLVGPPSPPPHRGSSGCFPLICLAVGGIAGYNQAPEGSLLLGAVGLAMGLLVGFLVERLVLTVLGRGSGS